MGSTTQFEVFVVDRFDSLTAASVPHAQGLLNRPAVNYPLADRVRQFCEDPERAGAHEWQVEQAERAIRIYFANFLQRPDWHAARPGKLVASDGPVDVLPALDALRARIRARHCADRTECSYVDWVRCLLTYAADQQGGDQSPAAAEQPGPVLAGVTRSARIWRCVAHPRRRFRNWPGIVTWPRQNATCTSAPRRSTQRSHCSSSRRHTTTEEPTGRRPQPSSGCDSYGSV